MALLQFKENSPIFHINVPENSLMAKIMSAIIFFHVFGGLKKSVISASSFDTQWCFVPFPLSNHTFWPFDISWAPQLSQNHKLWSISGMHISFFLLMWVCTLDNYLLLLLKACLTWPLLATKLDIIIYWSLCLANQKACTYQGQK